MIGVSESRGDLMKFSITFELEKLEGPNADEEDVRSLLIEEIESLDLWVDDSNYAVSANHG